MVTIKKNEETAIEKFIKEKRNKYKIPKVALSALESFGIYDARVLSVLTEAEIAAIDNISEKTASSLVKAADDTFRGPLFQKAADQSERLLRKRQFFTTGSEKFNTLLGGGMPTSAVVEINGEYRTGKTQTCLTCAVTAQLPKERGGLDRSVIYIDTENSFNANHLQKIGERFGIPREELLDNLFVVQAEQLRYLSQAIDRLPGYVQALDPGLIVVDSLMAPFRTEFHELNELAIRQKKIGKVIGLLKRIAIAFNTTILFTNQVLANIGFGSQYVPVKATGGHVIAHASDIRIFMKKLKGKQRRAQIQDCAWLPPDKAEFYITDMGISDKEEPAIYEEEEEEEEKKEKKGGKKEKKKDEKKEEEEEKAEETKASQKEKEEAKNRMSNVKDAINEIKELEEKGKEVKKEEEKTKKKGDKEKEKEKKAKNEEEIKPREEEKSAEKKEGPRKKSKAPA
ncbi:MAG: hypothetical protein GF308_13590 [Candidatus Heimdallarchaeota archaeon]|nr:hypothetical protein [Candidatus Heimdallarchaeota archaeon]